MRPVERPAFHERLDDPPIDPPRIDPLREPLDRARAAAAQLSVPVLAQKFRVLAPDIAGFGYTERKPDQVYDLDFWVSHLVAFMDAVGVAKACFVGNSFGGALTLALTARHPERVASLKQLLAEWEADVDQGRRTR